MNKLYDESSVRNIADAIRSVNGSTDTYTIGEMATAVSSISTGLDWAELNYNTSGPNKGMPDEIINGFKYAKDIMDSYTSTTKYTNDKQLLFWPNIDITGRYDYNSMFYESNLLHVDPLTVGSGAEQTAPNMTAAFYNTLIEDVTINSVDNQITAYARAFYGCIRLKTVTINTPCSSIESMFEECKKLTTVNIDSTATANCSGFKYCFKNCESLVNPPMLDTSHSTELNEFLKGCKSIVTAPSYDTGNCSIMNDMLRECTALVNVPIYDTSHVTSFTNMFLNSLNLSDTSLDNILVMCINATNYTSTKTLDRLGINNVYDTRIQALPHYNDFINAGWIIR